MLADLSKLVPIKDAAPSSGAQRRRRGQTSTQKVLPRRENPSPRNEEKVGQQRPGGLSAYA